MFVEIYFLKIFGNPIVHRIYDKILPDSFVASTKFHCCFLNFVLHFISFIYLQLSTFNNSIISNDRFLTSQIESLHFNFNCSVEFQSILVLFLCYWNYFAIKIDNLRRSAPIDNIRFGLTFVLNVCFDKHKIIKYF